MKVIKLCFFFLLMLSLTFSCSDDSKDDLKEDFNQEPTTLKLPKDVLNAILEKGHNPSNFEYKEVVSPNGDVMQLVFFNDTAYYKKDFLNLYKNDDGVDAKQYGTEFKVDTDVYTEINVLAFVGSTPAGFGLSPAAVDAAKEAINNWNSVPATGIHLVLTVSDDPNFDFDVFETILFVDQTLGANSVSGFAQFPLADNSPGNFAVISSGANQLAQNNKTAIRHLITHELGHTIGFRHTDWDTRRSCVDNGIEPNQTREEDANYINGTPTTFLYQSNSIMNACFNTDTTNGRLNVFDKSALRVLYPSFPFFNF